MKAITRIFVLLLCASTIFAVSEKKRVEKTFKVDPGQRIEIRNLPGMNVKVKTWDKNEVKFDLLVSISSSDEEFENEYIEKFDIVEYRTSSDLIIEFEQPSGGGWSFWDIFELKFHYYVEKQIRGDIFVPRNNDLYAEFKYSDIDLRGMEGELELDGRSNDLVLSNCRNIRKINNLYGDAIITRSAGDMLLESRSSTIKIMNFDGPVKIEAPYSDVELYDIKSSADVSTRSANVKIEKVDGDLTLDAPYCDIEIDEVNGVLKASDRSGNFSASRVMGVVLDIPYTSLKLSKINVEGSEPIKVASRSESHVFEDIVGDLNINDTYSNFEMNNITGNVYMLSRSGEIEVSNFEGDWDSETQYSSLKFTRSKMGKVKIRNRSNPVTMDLLSVPSSVDINNQYGAVEITIPKGFAGEVELKAVYGDIDCAFPLRFKSEGSTATAYGYVGTGNGSIIIETRSGDIVIKEK